MSRNKRKLGQGFRPRTRPAQPAEGIRAFIALELTPACIEALMRLQQRLATSGADVRWVGAEGLHLTFKFLGTITPEQQQQVQAALARSAARVPAFAFDLAQLGVFPDRRRPRIIWIGPTTGTDDLVHCQREVEREMAPCGFPTEKRRFHPHVTLGRVRSSRGVEQLATAVQEVPVEVPGPLAAAEVILFRSDLQPTGARYSVLQRVELGGGRVDDLQHGAFRS